MKRFLLFIWFYGVSRVYLVAPVSAMSAVRMATIVWIVRFDGSSIAAKYTNVLTTAMNESQKSMNWENIYSKLWEPQKGYKLCELVQGFKV